MNKWYLKILGVLLCAMIGGTAVAQTSVLRDAEQRERQQKERERQQQTVVGAEVMRQVASNFVVVAPGVVRDQTTGLEWMRCSLGQDWDDKRKTCEGNVGEYTFDNAQDIARRLNNAGGYNGKADWRVPKKDELASLVVCSSGRSNNACANGSVRPTIAQTVFPRTVDKWYWTSVFHRGDFPAAWYVSFYDGDVDFAYGIYEGRPVRLVRTSQ